jgi:hypothetical protein
MDSQVTNVVAVVVPVIGAVVWLVRLEGRINLADSRHADIKDDLREIKQTLGSIQRSMNGGGPFKS